MRIMMAIAALALCVLAGRAMGQDKPDAAPAGAPAASDFSLTIYSTADPATFDPRPQAGNGDSAPVPGYGVVREIRKIDLQAGENTVKFTDVASGIDPTTVTFKSRTAPDSTTVLEQNYEYDLTSPDALLNKYIDKEVIINRKQPPLTDDKTRQPETIQGKLLSFDANAFVLQSNNKQLPVQIVPRNADIQEIKLFDLQTGLVTKPTLLWKVNTDKAAHDAEVTYQTDGLTWRADYSFMVNADESAVDIGAWVSIVNKSGASYPDARLKLVAGDVQRLTPPQQDNALQIRGEAAQQGFTEKPLFEYHLYTLKLPTSLADNSTKQIELFSLHAGVPVEKVYVYDSAPGVFELYQQSGRNRELDIPMNKKVGIYLKFMNTEANKLGMPLPAGRVRVYKKDEADGAAEFIGEDIIEHTPKDEKVLVRLGSAFDVVGERRRTDFKSDDANHTATETFEIKVRNHKKEAVKVLVKETLFRWEGWEITDKSDPFEKIDSHTIHFPIEIPANGEKVVTYTVRYTW